MNIRSFLFFMELNRYIHKSMGLENLIFKLLSFSAHNDDMGWITSDQLQMFILKEFIHLIDPRNSMDESFYEFYACTAVAKFLFYLDQRRTNKLSIRLLVHSVVMDELQNLAQLQTYQDEYLDTEYLSKIESNWFHYENVLNVYHSFLQLDADQNGLLSLREMEHFRGFSLHPMQFSKTAIRRIAEELIEFAPFELDYRGYLKLVLALDDVTNNTGDMSKTGSSATETNDEIRTPKNVHGLRFFWQVIDFDKSGVLSPMKIQYFINDIIPEMTRIGQYGEGEVPSVHTVIGEIYDMIGYNGSTNSFDTTQGPKLDQILSSHQADVILMMLLDTNTFYRYENRENLMHQSKHNDGDDHDHNQNTDDQLEYSSHQQGSTAGHTPRPPIGEEVKKKFDFNNLKYDDEDDIETDYEF